MFDAVPYARYSELYWETGPQANYVNRILYRTCFDGVHVSEKYQLVATRCLPKDWILLFLRNRNEIKSYGHGAY